MKRKPAQNEVCMPLDLDYNGNQYNPTIIGFLKSTGHVQMNLQEAKRMHGELPSKRGVVLSNKDEETYSGRRGRKTLNLPLGVLITKKLRKGSLKKTVFDFYKKWHRNYKKEFGIDTEFFFNLNDPNIVKKVITENNSTINEIAEVDVKEYLRSTNLIKIETLNSIKNDNLLGKAEEILKRKKKDIIEEKRLHLINTTLDKIKAIRIVKSITDFDITNTNECDIYADEIAKELYKISRYISLSGIDKLACVRGKCVEFEYTPRDFSFLELGMQAGDCTAEKFYNQVDRNTTNIYWTVFTWILDRNYQIIMVFYNGKFVMKVHLVLLFSTRGGRDNIFLGIDAIEISKEFRDDIKQCRGRDDLLKNKEYIFKAVIEKVKEIAKKMKIQHIYSEKFSNAKWVREELNKMLEIHLNVEDIKKLDDLEDILELAQQLCKEESEAVVEKVFMEIQMKNTHLIQEPESCLKNNIKSFAIIQGNQNDGIPIKNTVKI